MQVETFEVQEVQQCATNAEALETVKGFIDSLGLEGQAKFYGVGQEQSTICPYRKITAQEKMVYKTLCPVEVGIGKYAEGPIPLRILQVATHAKTVLESGCELVVWHPANGDIKDPVLLGKIKVGTWDYHYYLLARWGEVLEEFAVLQAHAVKITVEELKAQADRAQAELTGALASLEAMATSAILKGNEPHISLMVSR